MKCRYAIEISKLARLPIWWLCLFCSCKSLKEIPPVQNYRQDAAPRKELSPHFYASGPNRLRKDDQGMWELYVQGDAYERGLAYGILTRELMYKQENAFVTQIRQLVPSGFKLKLLRQFLKFFNRSLPKYVPEEYKTEIYGLSRASSPDFDFIAPAYLRILFFHGAHDIGHALQDLAMVGCTSFAAWGGHTADGKLLIGRNFDFYAGDAFAEQKLVSFIKPDKGYAHAMVSWPGMLGVVSGMNIKGLTVTINAGKSNIPLKAKEPISLVTREILQYASTIDEAIAIARKKKVFVSEAILVGSAADGKAVSIEISPKKFGVYEVRNGADELVCTNHFQSEPYLSDKHNLERIIDSHSKYRFDRMNELLSASPPLTPMLAAGILRNRDGMGGSRLGFGNEKAIDQLLAHHAVIFQPEDRVMWVSSNPYQLGEFVAYDLNKVFAEFPKLEKDRSIAVDSLNIPADPFIHSQAYANYGEYRRMRRLLEQKIADEDSLNKDELDHFIGLNPDFWEAYFIVANYYNQRKNYKEALFYYEAAAAREVTTIPDRRELEKRIKQCKRNLK